MEVDPSLIEKFKDLDREDAQFRKNCDELVQEVNLRQLTIVQLVEQLGVFLVDASPNNRETGTWILTRVLEGLAPDDFDANQLTFICTFYADRLKDHHQVVPAVIAGVLALCKFRHFPEGAATRILSALFQNVSCQQQQERDRHVIYKIFEALLEKHATELCTMGLDYIYGVISAVDGERSPKNLVLLFNWFPKFLKTVNLGHLTEEAFEVLACYFPVDFKAPTKDQNAITREQLASLLAPCLTAIPQFSEFCFPLALEKMDSSLEIAKLDSLNLLKIGCSSFNTVSYVQHATEIWSHIQKEVFMNANPTVEVACLSALTSMIVKISDDPSLKTAVKDISDTLKGNLLPESKLFEHSSKLLLSVASATEVSSDLVTKEICPILINTFNITTTKAHKIIILKSLVLFFESYVRIHGEVRLEELNLVPVLCLKSTLDEGGELKKVGFDCLGQIAEFLPKDVRFSLYENLRTLLFIPQSEGIRVSILGCFDKLAEYFPLEVKEQLVGNTEITNEQILESYLEALWVIVGRDIFTETIINILLDYLTKGLNLSRVVIISLKNMLTKYEFLDTILIDKDMVTTLVDFSVGHEDDLDVKYLNSVAFILSTLMRNQSVAKQNEILNAMTLKIQLLKPKRIFILHGILTPLRRDVKLDYKVLADVTEFLLKQDDVCVKETAAQLLANLINKCGDEAALQSYLSQLSHVNSDVTMISWVTKGLVMRNHQAANVWIERLMQLLENDESVATSFRIIISDKYDSLSTKNYCLKTFLYQQKFFTIVSNKLCDNYSPDRSSYLLALGYLLESAPKQAILLQFKKILKLIVLCLDQCEESNVVTVILQVIKEFIINKEKCMEDHFSDFLARFLKLSTFDKSMKVRILALQCLRESVSSFPTFKLLIHRTEVLTVLGKAVDDRKRMVRREAVEARSLWFLLDSPQ